MPLNTGSVLNSRYRIVSLLGQGGFGAVYRAWDLNLKRPCAVKENLETNPQSQKQFENEATVLANLYHQHLPRVIDHFVLPEQGQYLVMDFVEGQDLYEMVHQRGKLPVKQAIEWISQIADALGYLHNQKHPVIHRDIKPANIRVTSDGKAFLVDFGLVKLYATQAYTTPGARGVTSGYSPPEQYGHGGTDARTDIYGLAATLYTLLTGEVPPESVHRYGQEKLSPAHLVNPDVPPALGQVIHRAMSLDPEHRYQTAREFKAGLDAALVSSGADTLIAQRQVNSVTIPQRLGTVVAPPVVPQGPGNVISKPTIPPASPFWQNRVLLGGVVVVILVLCAVVVYALWYPGNDDGTDELDVAATEARETEIAMWSVETLTAEVDNWTLTPESPEIGSTSTSTDVLLAPDEPTLTPTPSPMPADTLTPTMAQISYDLTFASDRDGEFQVYLMDTLSGDIKALPRPSGYERVWWPSFCGDKIAVEAQDTGSGSQWVYLIDILSGQAERLGAPPSPANLGVPRCSPDGGYLTYSGSVDKVWIMFVTDFSNTYQINPSDGWISGYASWPASGTDFLFQVITQDDYKNIIYRMNGHPSGGSFTKIDSGGNPALSPDGSRMIYSCEITGNDRTLCVSDANGDNSTQFVNIIRKEVPGVGWNIQPASAWSADGGWIYYASAEDGDWDIYRIRPDGSGLQNLTDDWGSGNEINPALKW